MPEIKATKDVDIKEVITYKISAREIIHAIEKYYNINIQSQKSVIVYVEVDYQKIEIDQHTNIQIAVTSNRTETSELSNG